MPLCGCTLIVKHGKVVRWRWDNKEKPHRTSAVLVLQRSNTSPVWSFLIVPSLPRDFTMFHSLNRLAHIYACALLYICIHWTQCYRPHTLNHMVSDQGIVNASVAEP